VNTLIFTVNFYVAYHSGGCLIMQDLTLMGQEKFRAWHWRTWQ